MTTHCVRHVHPLASCDECVACLLAANGKADNERCPLFVVPEYARERN